MLFRSGSEKKIDISHHPYQKGNKSQHELIVLPCTTSAAPLGGKAQGTEYRQSGIEGDFLTIRDCSQNVRCGLLSNTEQPQSEERRPGAQWG